MKKSRVYAAITVATMLLCTKLQAQQHSTEERFQDLFITAGYGAAFGAALGAAALSFKTSPENHLRYVAIGASLGFIGGSALGTYVIFSPMFVEKETPAIHDRDFYAASSRGNSLTISPVISLNTKTIDGIVGSANLASF